MVLGCGDSLRRKRLLLRALTAAVLGVVMLILSAPAALAQPSINVEVGFSGQHRGGADLLVQVEVDTDRLIDGQLVITSRFGERPSTVVVPVEIAGGARKRFVAVVPTVSQGMGLTVQLLEGNTTIAQETVNPGGASQDELVGVLPTLVEDMPANADLAVELGRARFAPVSEAILAAGPGAIDALDTVVGSADDMSALSAEALDTLRTWVAGGGQLVLDEAPGPIPGFSTNAALTPTGVGSGSILASGGALAQGDWDGTLFPTSLRQDPFGPGGMTGELTGEMMWFGGPLENALAGDAGFGLPSMNVVLPLMAVYVLLVGPLAFVALRRMGRPQLLWLALPAAALLCTLIVWFAGSQLRSNTNDAHGSIIEVADDQAFARSSVLRSSRNGGTTTIDLPDGWRGATGQDLRFGPGSGGNAQVRFEGTEALSADLDAGQFVLLSAEGPVSGYQDALTITATSDENGVITGSVTNQLDVALEEVAVFAPFMGVNIGTVGAGQTVTFELSGREQNPRFGEPVDAQVWRDASSRDFGPFGPVASNDSVVSLELWALYVSENIGRLREPGTVLAVGWTRDLPSPLDENVERGRTAVVARTDVESTGPILTDMASQRVLLRGPEQLDFAPNFGPGFEVTTAWRFDVPAGIDLAALALELPASISMLEIWVGDAWFEFDDPTGGLYEVPPEAWVGNSLFVKPAVDFERNPMLGRDFSLQHPGDAEVRSDLLDLEEAS